MVTITAQKLLRFGERKLLNLLCSFWHFVLFLDQLPVALVLPIQPPSPLPVSCSPIYLLMYVYQPIPTCTWTDLLCFPSRSFPAFLTCFCLSVDLLLFLVFFDFTFCLLLSPFWLDLPACLLSTTACFVLFATCLLPDLFGSLPCSCCLSASLVPTCLVFFSASAGLCAYVWVHPACCTPFVAMFML